MRLVKLYPVPTDALVAAARREIRLSGIRFSLIVIVGFSRSKLSCLIDSIAGRWNLPSDNYKSPAVACVSVKTSFDRLIRTRD